MREQLLDLLERLVGVRAALGEDAFERACHKARVAVARVVLDEAVAAAQRVPASKAEGRLDNNPRLTTIDQDDTRQLF